LVAFYKVHPIAWILTALLYEPVCLYVYKCAAAIQKLQEKNFILNLGMQRIPSAYWIPDYVAADYPGCRPSKSDIIWLLFYICGAIHIAFISPKHHHLPINAVPFKVIPFGHYTVSPAIILPFEAFCEVHCLKLWECLSRFTHHFSAIIMKSLNLLPLKAISSFDMEEVTQH